MPTDKFVITDMILNSSGATGTHVGLHDDSTELLRVYLAPKGGLAIPLQYPIKSATATNEPKIYVSQGGVTVTLIGYEEA